MKRVAVMVTCGSHLPPPPILVLPAHGSDIAKERISGPAVAAFDPRHRGPYPEHGMKPLMPICSLSLRQVAANVSGNPFEKTIRCRLGWDEGVISMAGSGVRHAGPFAKMAPKIGPLQGAWAIRSRIRA